MFVVAGQQADAEIREQSEIDGLVRSIHGGGPKPLIRSMLEMAATAAGVSSFSIPVGALVRSGLRRPDIQSGPPGDLFFSGDKAFILQPVGPKLQAWEIRRHDTESQLAEFCKKVESAARASLDGRRLRGMDFLWKAIQERPARRYAARSRLYKEQKLEKRAPEYTPSEAVAARLLVDPVARGLLLRLAQVGKVRSVDAAADADLTVAGQLTEAGLLRREFLVMCRQDSHTICVVKDRSDLESGQGGAFTCSICGRAFKDEKVHEVFAVTEGGRKLLGGSRWMTIWITELLVESGVARADVAWNAIAGEDELDVMTDALGPRVFFELKDREFGLGDAYPFAFRVSRYGGLFGIVVSTERVAAEAKKFFEEQRQAMDARIEWLEGSESIARDLKNVVDRVSRSGVNELLLELSESIGMNLVPVARAWMDRTAQSRPVTPDNLLHPTGAGPASAAG